MNPQVCLIGLLVLSTALLNGCNRGPSFGDAKGKVLLDGKPMPGGMIIFTNEEDNLMASGYMRPDGTYEIAKVPAGKVRVAIRNEEFRGQLDEKAAKALQKKGIPIVLENDPNKGTKFVPIPEKYSDPKLSGLTYEVKPDEMNAIDIELKK